ncbi:MAG: hypothetical protein WAP49_15525 [Mycobacterium sp.]
MTSFRPEPRCHVCRTDSIRARVNAMLAKGASYAQIVRAVGAEDGDPVTLDSVRNHASRHFPVQNAAQATYREIVERRAAENEIDFEKGLKIALTPMAYLETLMVKGFEKMVQDSTEVSVEAGLRAAEKLQAVLMAHDHSAAVAQMKRDVNLLQQAVKSTVPPEMMIKISARIDELKGTDADDEDDDLTDDDDDLVS